MRTSHNQRWLTTVALFIGTTLGLLSNGHLFAAEGYEAIERNWVTAPPAPKEQTHEQMMAKSEGCLSCHEGTDAKTMHANPAVKIGCTDCHGGNATEFWRSGHSGQGYANPAYMASMERAHVLPRYPEAWHYPSSANPKRSYT